MIIQEETSKECINSLEIKDWKPLFDLIPEIENAEKNDNNNTSTTYSEVITKFHTIVYSIPIIISFDWPSWEEGRKMASDKNFDFNTVDVLAKCKLITAIIRNDRFCEGALESAFRSGLILKILKSIRDQIVE